MSLRLPSMVLSIRPTDQKAYPYEKHRYGGKSKKSRCGGASSFFADRVRGIKRPEISAAKTPEQYVPPVESDDSGSHSMNTSAETVQGKGRKQGKGYFGSNGWTNTQPHQARRELSEEDRLRAELDPSLVEHKEPTKHQAQLAQRKLSQLDASKSRASARSLPQIIQSFFSKGKPQRRLISKKHKK